MGPWNVVSMYPVHASFMGAIPDYFMKGLPNPTASKRRVIPSMQTVWRNFALGTYSRTSSLARSRTFCQLNATSRELLLRQDGIFSQRMESFISFGYEGRHEAIAVQGHPSAPGRIDVIDREAYLLVIYGRTWITSARTVWKIPTELQTVVGAGWSDSNSTQQERVRPQR